MPTILTLHQEKVAKVLVLLNEARQGKRLTVEELKLVKACVNRSIVGASKLLHFINPEVYAIWDSRTYAYCMGKKNAYATNKVENYVQYLDGLEAFREGEDFEEFKRVVALHFDYEVSDMRAMEFVMFEWNRREGK